MEFWDEYDHPDPNITYLPENIKHQEFKNETTPELPGCDCTNECTIQSNCECLKRSGTHYNFKTITDLTTYTIQIKDSRKPSYECNRNCACCETKVTTCGNRLIQYGPRKGLKIITCNKKHKGLGLTTNFTINTGTFVCEYVGVIFQENEAKKRIKLYESAIKMNYIFCINETFGENTVKTFIDPTNEGNIARYINHSCDPNCVLVQVRVHNIVPKLCIFAQRDIKAGEEITFSYGKVSEIEGCSTATNRKPCLCEAGNCMKFLPNDLAVLN